MKWEDTVLIVLMCITTLCVLVNWIHFFTEKEKGIEITDCYDRFNNKIIGHECITKNMNQLEEAVFISMFGGMIIIFNLIILFYPPYI